MLKRCRGVREMLRGGVGTGRRWMMTVPRHNMLYSAKRRNIRWLSGADKSIEGESRWVLKSDLEIEATNAVAHNNWVAKPLSGDEITNMNSLLGVASEDEAVTDSPSDRKKNMKNIVYNENYLNTAGDGYSQKIKGFLDWNPAVCSGCGTPFQSKSLDSPGYLSKEKFHAHKINADLIRKQQDAVHLLDVAGISTTSSLAEEILRSAGVAQDVIDGVVKLGNTPTPTDEIKDPFKKVLDTPSVPTKAALMTPSHAVKHVTDANSNKNNEPLIFGYDPNTLEPIYDIETFRSTCANELPRNYDNLKSKKQLSEPKIGAGEREITVCQRCFRLEAYGDIENKLRPGWSDHELLTPARFAELLSQIKNTKAVVLCLIDLFDVEGSLLSNLNEIAGRNPIIIAANKVDLLPNDAVLNRVSDWVYASVKSHCNLLSPKEAEEEDQKEYLEKGWYRSRMVGTGSNKEAVVGILRRADVHLISCDTGKGIKDALQKVIGIAAGHGEKIYVMGTANVGKSSFINRLLEFSEKKGSHLKKKKGSSRKRDNIIPQATVSNLPGTTLDFLKIRLPNGIVVYDTPGLINEGQLTSRLTPHELRQVIPKKQINHITLRMEEGRVIMIGGLARVEHVEGRPFLCTFFISNKIKLHPTRAEKVSGLLQNHMGSMIFPPQDYGRVQELGPMEDFFFDVEGNSWDRASKDIVIAGLGWMSITGPGPGNFCVKVSAPVGTTVRARDPIMPFEAKDTTASHTGGRFVKKSSKKHGHGNNRRIKKR